jgi:hypothetical protein
VVVSICREKSLIFRITHIDNVSWILENGLHCNTSSVRDPAFKAIGNPKLIGRRHVKKVPVDPGGRLDDYVPFYFTPHSIMLYNIKTGHDGLKQFPMSEIAILVSSLHRVAKDGLRFLFTDRHALTMHARFSGDLEKLDWIDWKLIASRDFSKKSASDVERCARYQAEALIHRQMPVNSILGIVVYGKAQATRIAGEMERLSLSLKLVTKPDWFF